MKVTVTVKNLSEFEKNKDKVEKIKKIINKDVEVRYLNKKSDNPGLSFLSGIVSIGGDSVKDTESLYE